MAGGFGGGHGGYGRPQIRFGGPLTPTIKFLLIANVAVFLLTLLPNLTSGGQGAINFLNLYLGMTPAIFWSQFTLWMPFTYLFLHGSIMHVLFNMLMLWFLGGEVEQVFGTKRFIFYYFLCGAGAGLLVALLQMGMTIPTIGASGAIYGILVAFGLFFPERLIYIYGIFPVKAKYLVIGAAALAFLFSLSDSGSTVSHVAHLSGIAIGYVYIRWRRITGRFKATFRRKPKQKADVIDLEQMRKMFEDNDDDQKVH